MGKKTPAPLPGYKSRGGLTTRRAVRADDNVMLATGLLSPIRVFQRAVTRLGSKVWRSRQRPRYALALGGGGVIGGMYEVGALAALGERLDRSAGGFDGFVGRRGGCLLAALLAHGVVARALYRSHYQD